MKTITTITFLLLSFLGFSQNQGVEVYTQKLSKLMDLFQASVMSKEKCESVWDKIREYKKEVDEFKSKGGFSHKDNATLLFLSETSELFDDYFICIGAWNHFPIRKERFIKASSFFDNHEISYISKNIYCIDIVEYKLNDLVAYFAINNSEFNYKISYLFTQGFSKQSGEMGLASGMIRLMIDNREGSISNYTISNLSCQKF